MRLDPGPTDWLKLVVLVIGVPMLARSTYVALGRYRDWKSPWKRMLVIAPLLIVTVLAIAAFIVVTTE